MEIKLKSKFLKELNEIEHKYSSKIEKFVFEELPKYEKLESVGKIEKMNGYTNFFKIRFGNYRIGLKKEGNTLILETTKHRKEIYKYFP